VSLLKNSPARISYQRQKSASHQYSLIDTKDKKLKAKDDEIQDELAKSNEFKNELAKKNLRISELQAALKDEFNSLPNKQKNSIEQETEYLKALLKKLDMHDFEVRRNSHPRRELAFRLGIELPDTKSRVAMKLLQHVDRNNWLCELLNYKKYSRKYWT
jgi:hypothetical protein